MGDVIFIDVFDSEIINNKGELLQQLDWDGDEGITNLFGTYLQQPNEAVKSIKKTRQTLKLEQEAKKQSQKVNKVAKMPTNKIDMSKPSATLSIKEPISTKNDPNKRGSIEVTWLVCHRNDNESHFVLIPRMKKSLFARDNVLICRAVL